MILIMYLYDIRDIAIKLLSTAIISVNPPFSLISIHYNFPTLVIYKNESNTVSNINEMIDFIQFEMTCSGN